MKKPKFGPIILAFIIFLGILLIPSHFLLSFIDDKKIEKEATELNPLMFQGVLIQKKMLASDHYFPIYGSSELSRLDAYHPSNYFAVNNDHFTPFLYGRGGTQSLIQFLNFAALKGDLKDKKIVFIMSPQWFQKNGMDEMHFAPNFSLLQGYDLAFNNSIDPNLKKKAIKRLVTYDAVKKDKMLNILYQAELKDDPWLHTKALAVYPFARVYKGILEKKDLYFSLVGGIPKKREIAPEKVKDKSWDELIKLAEEDGYKHSQSNPFGIEDKYYKRKVEKKVDSLKDYKVGASYGNSPEYDDFQLVLDVLKEAKAKPIFISVPCNGSWYDYTGFPLEGRTSYYNKIKAQIEKAGYPVADYTGHEYDRYFLKDPMHLGWKGWVYVDRDIKAFYDQK